MNDRQTGRTQKMLEDVAEAVRNNPGHYHVVAHSFHHAVHSLRPRLFAMLGKECSCPRMDTLAFRDSTIQFHTVRCKPERFMGVPDETVFFDNHAIIQKELAL